ncbi:MAG: hypothetical protein M1827_005602 [Pycnora praestabilis]|nr:MAG: hypothetical protein M1827_005602 [Pycnora praestabilis]
MTDKSHKLASADGHFHRPASKFRSSISSSPNSPFPPAANRYVLYINYGCPWAHRANLVLQVKGLDGIIEVVAMDYEMTPQGWSYTGRLGTAKEDPLYGFKYHKQLYEKAEPGYTGRYTVPVLWDRERETLVNNESSEIIRMFYSEFDALLPVEMREVNRSGGGLYPKRLRGEIDSMNEWVYDTVNNGVYKTGFAATQEAYEEHLHPLFASLDRLEAHLAEPGHQPYLFGENITEADIRLFTTLIRFDVAYVTIFKCNLRMIRHDYPRLHAWLRRLYWDESPRTNGGAFRKTTYFDHIKKGYTKALKMEITPAGPNPDILPLGIKG